jgi:Recombination endonuclease VII
MDSSSLDERKKKRNEQARGYYKINPERYRAASRRYREKHPYIHKEKVARTHCKHGHELTKENVYAYVSPRDGLVRECKLCVKSKNNRRATQLRENHLNRKFNMTVEQFNKKLEEQGGRCAVCKTLEPGGMGSFHVDHDHDSGEIRKLLCMNCNRCLGAAKDNPKLLDALASYLRDHGKA